MKQRKDETMKEDKKEQATNENKYKYLSFPLNDFQGFFDNPDGVLYKIFVHGLLRFANSLQLTDIQIAKQTIYSFYNGKLLPELEKGFQKFIENGRFTPFEDHKGFDTSGEFNPEENIEELIQLFAEMDVFRTVCNIQAQYNFAIFLIEESMNIKLDGLRKSHPGQWDIEKEIQEAEGKPVPQVKTRLLLDFMLKVDKTESDLLQFAGYIAALSILGKATYKRTNKEHIISRMFGFSSVKDLPESLHHLHGKMLNRYHFDKLKLALEANWNLLIYSDLGLRGYLIAKADKTSYDQLALIAEKGKLKNKKLMIESMKKEARKKAQQHLSKEVHLNKEFYN